MTSVKLLCDTIHTTLLIALISPLFCLEYHTRESVQTHIDLEYGRVETLASSGMSRAGPHYGLQLSDGRRHLSACDTCMKAQGRYFEQHLH